MSCMKISLLHKIVYYVLYLMCINLIYCGKKFTHRTYELSALGSVDKPPVVALCTVFTAHGRHGFIPSWRLLFMWSRAFYTWVKLCPEKVLNIYVRYVGLTDSSVTRVSFFRRFSQNCKKRLLALTCLSVHPSVRM